MKKYYILSTIILFLSIHLLNAQNVILMSNGTDTINCDNEYTFKDSGGDNNYNSTYGIAETLTFYASDPNMALKITFSSFLTESGYDFLTAYEGSGTDGTLIGSYTGTDLNGQTITSGMSNCITFSFKTDFGNEKAGWEAQISCMTGCQEFEATALLDGATFPKDIEICIGEELSLSASTSYPNNNINYSQNDTLSAFIWHFGDSDIKTGQNVSKVFEDNYESYFVTLTVRDTNGCMQEDTHNIKVKCGGDCDPCNDYFPGDGTVYTCEGTFWDPGEYYYYPPNGNDTITICSNNEGRIKLDFTDFKVLNNDHLYLFDGPNVDSPEIGDYTLGNSLSGVILGSGECITAVFTSNENWESIGWRANISCMHPCQEIEATFTTTPEITNSNSITTCPGQDVNFDVSLAFPENNTNYEQTLENCTLNWSTSIINGPTGTGFHFTLPADSAFNIDVILDVEDTNGCHLQKTINVISKCQEIDVNIILPDGVLEQNGEVFLPESTDISFIANYSFPENDQCYNQQLAQLNWNFGYNDMSSSSETAIITYPQGNFELELTIVDQMGCKQKEVKEIKVGCQPIDVSWEATPIALGDTIIVCPDSSFSINVITDYFANNLLYTQNDETSEFFWNFGDETTIENSINIEHSFSSAGIYLVNLLITDTNNCKDETVIPVYAFPRPTLEKSYTSKDTICYGESFTLVGKTNMIMPTYSAPPIFLDDINTGVDNAVYTSTLTFDMFGGEQIQSVEDIENLCLTIEHSYIGDLSIELQCPNGSIMEILPQPNTNSSYHLGEPCDIGSSSTIGIGYEYCFTPNASYSFQDAEGAETGSFIDQDENELSHTYYPAGDYLPTGSFNSLIGCPLNGDWSIIIEDHLGYDDGYIFNWGVEFASDGNLPPDSVQFPDENREWSLFTGPGGANIDPVTNSEVIVTPEESGNYTFRFEVTSPAGCSYDTLVPVYVAPLPEWQFEPDTFVCGTFDYFIDGYLINGDAHWSLYSGPGNAAFSNPDTIPTTITVDAYGDYVFLLTPQTIPKCAIPDTLKVSFYETPTVEAIIDSVDCFNACDGWVAVTPLGSETPYQYVWSNGDSTNIATSLCAGSINLTVSTNYCSNEYSYMVNQPTLLIVGNSEKTNNPCYGDALGTVLVEPAGGTPGYNYTWSPNSVNQNVNSLENLIAGTYEVTISDIKECTTTKTFVIEEPELPLTVNQIAPTHINCYDAKDGQLDLDIIGGTIPYTYNWSLVGGLSSNEEDPTGLDAGTHYVTITDAHGCETSGDQTLEQPTELLVSYSSTEPTCNGYDDGKIWLETYQATPPYQYEWSNGWTDSSIVQASVGLYKVTVTDSKGCIKVLSNIEIEQPNPVVFAIAPIEPICIGGTATLTISATSSPYTPYTYYWNGVVSEGSIDVSPTVTTDYTAKVVDAHGCESKDITKQVFVYEPINASVNLSNKTVCAGAAVNVTVDVEGGSPNKLFHLSDGTQVSDNFTLHPSETTEYKLIVNNDCDTPPDTVLFTINIEEPPLPSFHANVKKGCVPLTVDFIQDIDNHETGTQYLWKFGDLDNEDISTVSSPTHIFHTSGKFNISLEVTNPLGCKSTKNRLEYINVHPLPKASFSPNRRRVTTADPVIYFKNFSEETQTSLWYFGDGDSTYANNITHQYPMHKARYNVQLYTYSAYGCIDSTNAMVEVLDEVTFYMPTAFSPNDDELNDVYKPSFNGISTKTYSLVIYDKWGMKIFETDNPNEGWDGKINNNYVQPGAYPYNVKYTDSDNISHEKSGVVNVIR